MKLSVISKLHVSYIAFIIFIVILFNYYTRIIPDGKLQAQLIMRGPDVFGSVGVRINRSPYSSKWKHAAQKGSGAVWDKIVAGVRSRPSIDGKLQAVQYYVNRSAVWGNDIDVWKAEDYWATPNETLRIKSGDCEDFAILKMMLLSAAGISLDNMYLTVGYDTVLKQGHAVLVVRDNGSLWILDERTDAVIRDENFHYFNPVLSMNFGRNWVRGYRIAGVWVAPTDRRNLLGTIAF